MKLMHLLSGAGLVAGSVLVAPAAHAAVPINDTYDGRVSITTGTVSADTSEATTDAEDAALNEQCGAPATDASVWYSFTPDADGSFLVGLDADYSAGVIVASGGPGAWSLQNCGPEGTIFDGVAGTEYSILVFDDQFDEAGNGGNVDITIDAAPPAPEVDIDVDDRARFNADGSITLTGTATCTEGAFVGMDATVSQTVGRFRVSGYGFTELECTGGAQRFELTVFPDNGLFKGGRAASVTFAFACGEFSCGEDYEEQTVMVAGGKRR